MSVKSLISHGVHLGEHLGAGLIHATLNHVARVKSHLQQAKHHAKQMESQGANLGHNIMGHISSAQQGANEIPPNFEKVKTHIENALDEFRKHM